MTPPHNLEAEMAVLGAVLLSDTVLRPLLADHGLRPEHFYRESHGLIWRAMVELHDAGASIDQVTVAHRLAESGDLERAGGRAAIDVLAGSVPAVSALSTHATIVRDLHRRRELLRRAQALAAAIEGGGDEDVDRALAALSLPDDRRAALSTPQQLADRAYERYTADAPEQFPFPIVRLNSILDGGLRRGDYALLGGYESHGKSVLADQWLAKASAMGRKAVLYLTEMTEDERVDRIVSRLSGVPMSVIRKHSWTDDQSARVLAALKRIPFDIVDAGDWTVEEIRRHIEWHDHDAVVVDTLHDIERPPAENENEALRHISAQLRRAAKRKGTEKALLVVAHLNDNRVEDYPPLPVSRDLRGSGMLKRHADLIVMVWREPDEDREPSDVGRIRVTKQRQGELGTVPASFDGRRVRWGDHVHGLEVAA